MTNSQLADIRRSLAPGDVLRVAINYGNPVLAQRDDTSGEPRGVSVDIAGELARRLSVPVSFVTFDAAGKVFAAIDDGAWDVAFLAIDPDRASRILFTPPYCLIEGTYLVRADSPLRTIEEVDRPGTRITVASRSAYDLYLSRALQHATLVRAPSGTEAMRLFLDGDYEVAAGVKGPLIRFAAANRALRVMDGRFMQIRQAMATLQGRDAGWRYLCGFIEQLKADGFVAGGLQRSGQEDAIVAPAA